MAGFLKGLAQTMRRGESPQVQLGQPEIQQFLDLMNLEVVKLDKNRKELILVPKGSGSLPDLGAFGGSKGDKSPVSFMAYWLDSAFISQDQQDVEKDRMSRYDEYSVMDNNSSECSLTLDTYADEALASGRTHESPVDIEITDPKYKEEVIRILKAQDIISESHGGFASHRSAIRTLAKYGDAFHQFIKPEKNSPLQIQKIRNPAHITKIWDPQSQATLLFKKESIEGRGKENLFPWEICHYHIPDDQFHPYGRSILEAMRAAYKQLIINEALMALSRSSKVERLVVRVPTTGANPASVWSQLISAKAQWKNAIFGSADGNRTKSRIAALTDVLWMPGSPGKEYGIDRLQSSIDVSSIDDVEYFRDKLLMASRLPKSYFLADETQRLEEGALAQQDLKFSRSLLPMQFGYVDGLAWEITSILVMLGADMEKVKVSVKVDKPQALARAMVSGAEEAIRSVDALIESYVKATQGEAARGGFGGEPDAPKPKLMTDEAWVRVMRLMTGLPDSMLKVVAGLKKPTGELSPMTDSIEVFSEDIDPYAKSDSDTIITKWGIGMRDLKERQIAEGFKLAA